MKYQFGYRIYGAGAIAFGIITLVWQQVNSLGGISLPLSLVYTIGIFEIIGGLLIQWQGSKKIGALIIGSLFFIFTLSLVPPVFRSPLVYSNWGNLFEELSIAIGAVFLLATTFRKNAKRLVKLTYLCYAICVISYSLYQLFYLSYTANLVPIWLPPGQMFWAVATTIAFALAAFALFSGRRALLAVRLLTVMFIGFSLFVWLPRCISDPQNVTYWVGNAKTFIVAGTAWIVADYLFRSKIIPLRWPFVNFQGSEGIK